MESPQKRQPVEGLSFLFKGEQVKGVAFGPDSLYVSNFMQDYLHVDPQELLEKALESAPCAPRDSEAMKYRGNQLARTKFFLVEGEGPSDKPPKIIKKYTYPGWQWASMLFYRSFNAFPEIKDIVDSLTAHCSYSLLEGETFCPVVINHVIGTKYLSGEDYIGFHNDKMKDIREESLILLLSLGEQRELHIRSNPSPENAKPDVDYVVIMEPGSLFILGPRTNQQKQHAIVQVKDEVLISRSGPVMPRLSLVLRDIKTAVTFVQVQQHLERKRRAEERKRKAQEREGEKKQGMDERKGKVESRKSKSNEKRKRLNERKRYLEERKEKRIKKG